MTDAAPPARRVGLVGLVGPATDRHVRAVAEAVRRAKGAPTLLDLRRDPPPGLAGVYVRSTPAAPAAHHAPIVAPGELAEWLGRADAARRRTARIRAAHAALSELAVTVVNPASGYWRHRSKPAADACLARAGLAVPRSLVTSDPRALAAFVAEVGEAVYKPIAGGGACRAVGPEDLTPARLGALSAAPALVQQRIRGRDLRIYLLGGEVVGACAIETAPDVVDFRGNEEAVTPITVPEDLAELCRRAAEAAELVFTGIDVKAGADGYVFLDVNPSPMFLGVEAATGAPITDALAAHLLGPRPPSSSRPASPARPAPPAPPGELVILVERDDVETARLLDAAERAGAACRVVDLRRDRLEAAGDAVAVNGLPTTPAVVLNRTTVGAHTLPSSATLRRQRLQTWYGRHLAAREELGLVLAVLDAWEAAGAVLVNPPGAQDRALAARAPQSPTPSEAGRAAARVYVSAGRVVAAGVVQAGRYRTAPVSAATAATVLAAAEAAGLRMGHVDLAVSGDGRPPAVIAAAPVARFERFEADTGADVAAALLAPWLPGAASPAAPRPHQAPLEADRFFVADLVPNALQVHAGEAGPG